MDRRIFIRQSAFFGGSIALLGACKANESLTARFVKDPYDIELAREFVYYAHSNLEKLKEMHGSTPHLINSTVDWGDGDFESALGAASHVGNEEIARFLLSEGARMDIFAMAMLGMTDSLIGILDQFPNMVHTIGPHGFTLLHHAEVGVNSPELADYLREKGLTEKMIPTFKK